MQVNSYWEVLPGSAGDVTGSYYDRHQSLEDGKWCTFASQQVLPYLVYETVTHVTPWRHYICFIPTFNSSNLIPSDLVFTLPPTTWPCEAFQSDDVTPNLLPYIARFRLTRLILMRLDINSCRFGSAIHKRLYKVYTDKMTHRTVV